MASGRGARGVELEQLAGHFLYRLLGAPLHRLPGATADLVHPRCFAFVRVRPPALDQVQPIHGQAEDLPAGVFDRQGFDLAVPDRHALHSAEAPDAVVEVDHVVTLLELRETLQRESAAESPGTTHAPIPTEDLVVGQNPKRRVGALQHTARVERSQGDGRPCR